MKTKRDLRSLYEQEPVNLMKAMDCGDIDGLEKYLNEMLDALGNNIIHKHTAISRLKELYAYTQVSHGVRAAKLIIEAEKQVNRYDTKFTNE